MSTSVGAAPLQGAERSGGDVSTTLVYTHVQAVGAWRPGVNAMTIPLFLGYLVVVWIGAVILGGLLGGMATGFVVRRAGARLEAAVRALVAAEIRELARRARAQAAQLSAAVAVISAAVLRLVLRNDGFPALTLGIAIGFGAILAACLSVRWLRKDLAAFFRSSGRTTEAGSRPRVAGPPPGSEVHSKITE